MQDHHTTQNTRKTKTHTCIAWDRQGLARCKGGDVQVGGECEGEDYGGRHDGHKLVVNNAQVKHFEVVSRADPRQADGKRKEACMWSVGRELTVQS